jgi:hypothetical protein
MSAVKELCSNFGDLPAGIYEMTVMFWVVLSNKAI